MAAKNADRIRLTVSLARDVHATFAKMAEAQGMSLSRLIGEWLADTREGAEFVSKKMQEARSAPLVFLDEINGLASQLVRESAATKKKMESEVEGGAAAGERVAQRHGRPTVARPSPPSSNTGGKVPRENPKNKARRTSNG
jgi:hypothetical protein